MVERIKQAAKMHKPDYSSVLAYLKDQATKVIDVSIRTVSADNNYDEVKKVLDFFAAVLREKHDFDLIQAMINLFLQVHGEVLLHADEDVFERVKVLRELQRNSWQRLEDLLQNSSFMVRFLNNLPI
jgi:U3 small nucleolar RNA-associated protein 21